MHVILMHWTGRRRIRDFGCARVGSVEDNLRLTMLSSFAIMDLLVYSSHNLGLDEALCVVMNYFSWRTLISPRKTTSLFRIFRIVKTCRGTGAQYRPHYSSVFAHILLPYFLEFTCYIFPNSSIVFSRIPLLYFFDLRVTFCVNSALPMWIDALITTLTNSRNIFVNF